jgi:hypothetical protein
MPGIFESSTPVETSPEGQEVEAAEEQVEEVQQEEQEELEEQELEDQEEELEDDEESPDEGQDELIAGKFKSQDDLVNAYKNLEKEFHKSRQQPNQQTQQQQTDNPNEVFWNAFQQDPFGTMQYLVNSAVQESTAPIYEQQATNSLAKNIENLSNDYQQVNTEEGLHSLFDKIHEISEELGNPNLVNNPSKRILRMAAEEAFGDSKAALYKKAKQKGKEEAEMTRKSKQGLSGPSGTKPKQTEKSPEELIADSIVGAGSRGGLFG